MERVFGVLVMNAVEKTVESIEQWEMGARSRIRRARQLHTVKFTPQFAHDCYNPYLDPEPILNG